MRLAAFGDIHSNHIALEACIDAVEKIGIDGILFLGDYVSDCACPQKTLSLMREITGRHRCWFIRGNREEYMIDYADGLNEWRDNSQSGSLLYTYENLTDEDIEWFRSLPIAMRVEIEGTKPFEICHGAQWQTRVMLLPGTPHVDEMIVRMDTDLMLCAHTHEAFIIEKDGKTIVNGGTLGLPANGKAGASFAIIEYASGEWKPKLMRVKYDVEAVIREFHESGFMKRGHVWARAIAQTLRTSRHYTMECLELVGRYARKTGLPFGTEALWKRAAMESGLCSDPSCKNFFEKN